MYFKLRSSNFMFASSDYEWRPLLKLRFQRRKLRLFHRRMFSIIKGCSYQIDVRQSKIDEFKEVVGIDFERRTNMISMMRHETVVPHPIVPLSQDLKAINSLNHLQGRATFSGCWSSNFAWCYRRKSWDLYFTKRSSLLGSYSNMSDLCRRCLWVRCSSSVEFVQLANIPPNLHCSFSFEKYESTSTEWNRYCETGASFYKISLTDHRSDCLNNILPLRLYEHWFHIFRYWKSTAKTSKQLSRICGLYTI